MNIVTWIWNESEIILASHKKRIINHEYLIQQDAYDVFHNTFLCWT